MYNIPLFRVGSSFLFDVVWQSSLFLAFGLAASAVAARRPARAHRILVLAVVAALFTPVLARGVRLGGWGILTTTAARKPGAPEPRRDLESTAAPVFDSRASARSGAPEPPQFSRAGDAPGERTASDSPRNRRAGPLARMAATVPMVSAIDWRRPAIVAWLILAGLAVLRLLAGILLGVHLVRRARRSQDGSLAAAAAIAAGRIRVSCVPELRVSPQVRCPSIWCWRRRPLILMPESFKASASVDWAGVFCHELAHWVRRDHLSRLFADLLLCALPWHPLAWWSRQRLGQLAELACDDWVLATGVAAPDYAESLLGLVPQRSRSLALAAVTGRRGLAGRVRHILDDGHPSPAIGKRWAWLSAAGMVLAAATLALAQTRPGQTPVDDVTKRGELRASRSSTAAHASASTLKKRTIHGRVLAPDGEPAPGATVLWVGQVKPPLTFSALSHEQQQAVLSRPPEIIARSETGADGSFTLACDFDPSRYEALNGWETVLLVKLRGAGILAQKLKDGMTDLTLPLAPEVIVHGRLLDPSGKPATRVRVALRGIHAMESQGMRIGSTASEEAIPPYWPGSRQTDADGRFTLEGIPQGSYATLEFWPADHAVDEITVSARTDGAVSTGLRSFDIPPVSPNFTHALEPARPVQGRVTDRRTGKPLAGILISVTPRRRRGGTPFSTRTDADGRYRVSGHQAEKFWINVYPSADSGYLAASDRIEVWPAGARFAERNIALNLGRLVHGQVIDADTKVPVARAGVVYQPVRGNPHNTGGYDLRNTVLTDDNGRFGITALPGSGFLATETADENYIRVHFTGGDRGSVYPQGLSAINVPEAGDPRPVTIEVKKGVTLEAKAIGPDGKVVRGITAFCKGIDAKLIDIWNKAQPFDDGVFRLRGADPGRTYRVFFLQFEKKLGAVAELKYNPNATGPIEVKLQATAQVHGEFVSPGGSPATGGQVLPYMLLEKEQSEFKANDVRSDETSLMTVQFFPAAAWSEFFDQSKLRGTFRFEHLIPGVRYGISARSFGQGGGRESTVTVQPLSPGEDRDLGKIILKEVQP
jgi:beta-lactamase regulating signal transducer with metallopeptidase domain